jgi:hypothetical protein
MSDFKKFRATYTNERQERVTEQPRLMVTVDGKHKSLFLGDDIVLATVPIESPDSDLWNQARLRLHATQ